MRFPSQYWGDWFSFWWWMRPRIGQLRQLEMVIQSFLHCSHPGHSSILPSRHHSPSHPSCTLRWLQCQPLRHTAWSPASTVHPLLKHHDLKSILKCWIKYKLTDKTSGALLCDFDAEGTRCDRLITIAIYRDTLCDIKEFVSTTIILPFRILARGTLMAFNGNTCQKKRE